ncbi:asparagine synthase-related protein [Streptomyces buecherae]|uniref:asparagine synthase-related protein n=1 Tax=Streptomyces buecherae TaxID=2763006 RepID=UPI003696BE93
MRQDLTASQYARALGQADQWPLHTMRMELAFGRPVRITGGPRGVGPLYLRDRDTSLDGSWDVLDLDPDPTNLDEREAAAYLAYRPRYSSTTLFRGVCRLTERATAVWSPSAGLTVNYPEPALHSKPRVLREDADPVAAFTDLLRQEIAARPLPADQCAVELSGGMDSTMTALSLAETVGPAHAAALILGGSVGGQQTSRRREIIQRAGLGSDVTVPVEECAPFLPDGARATGQVISPMDGTYAEAMTVLYQRLAACGVRWLLTGIGGDELCFQRPEERLRSGDPWNVHPVPDHLGPRARAHLPYLTDALAPASVLHASTVATIGVHSATAMRRGLWPISPLATPLLLRFSESLPHEWRRDKELMRRRLQAAGYSPHVVRPRLPENFSDTCERAMLRYGRPLLDRLIPDLLLTKAGLIDSGRLATQCAQVAATGKRASELYRPLALEASLRAL